MAQYDIGTPATAREAIGQGVRAAESERRRLALGDAALDDVIDLLEANGVRAFLLAMPDTISGLTVGDPMMGALVAANSNDHFFQRRFSFAREYAHVLFDRTIGALVSRRDDQTDLRQVRANAFASSLLMPEAGIRRKLEELGKLPQGVIDPVSDARRRRESAHPSVEMHDIVLLAHAYKVSRRAVLDRLRSIYVLAPRRFAELCDLQATSGPAVARLLGLTEPDHEAQPDHVRRRLVRLALEAYGRQKIGREKLMEYLTRDGSTDANEATVVIDAVNSSSR